MMRFNVSTSFDPAFVVVGFTIPRESIVLVPPYTTARRGISWSVWLVCLRVAFVVTYGEPVSIP